MSTSASGEKRSVDWSDTEDDGWGDPDPPVVRVFWTRQRGTLELWRTQVYGDGVVRHTYQHIGARPEGTVYWLPVGHISPTYLPNWLDGGAVHGLEPVEPAVEKHIAETAGGILAPRRPGG